MKNKVLLSTLLGSALLVGCTADDALDVRKNVAEGVNPTAPVFTVSFGDDLTRAAMATDGVHGIKWEFDDKMSLYHGGGDMPTTGEWYVEKFTNSDDFLKSPLQVRQFNAIYSVDKDNSGQPVFATSSMVNEGLAIMVYPADTTHSQIHQNPYIYLDIDQNENTKNKTPHVSEVMKIEPYDADKAHSAGYGRNYDVRMRQIGSQLRLTLDGQKAKVNDIEFRKVKIEVADADHSPFTVISEVKVGQLRRNAEGNNNGNPNVGKNTEQYNHYMYTPWIEPALGGKSGYISTTDIENNKTAIFTLLPYDDRTDNGGETYKSAFDESGKALFGNVTITVETNYGKVVLEEDEESTLWSKGEVKSTMTAGLASFLKAVFEPLEPGDDLYSGQLLGSGGGRTLAVDLSNLDMDKLHVKDQDELMKVLTVYDGLEITDPVTFILDGEKDGKYKNKFVLNKTNWLKLEERLAKASNKVSFAPCDEESVCTTIVLDNEGGSDAEEVPALQFAESVNKQNIVDIELVGPWKYNSEEGDKAKALDGINNLIVTKSLALANTTVTATGDFTIVIEPAATVSVSGVVELLENMENHGTINISNKTDRLSVGGEATLENCAAEAEDEDDEVDGFSVGGTINNYGTLASVYDTEGLINNYGYIKIWSKDAITLISNNADTEYTDEQFKTAFNSTSNRIGTVELFDKDGSQNNTSVTGNKGFIKLVLNNVADVTSTAAGSLANYLVLTGSTAKVSSIDDNQKYIEVNNEGSQVVFNNTSKSISLHGLIILKDMAVNIPSSSKGVTSAVTYVPNGKIIRAGGNDIFTPGQFTGYYGGASTDSKNILISNN